MKIKVADLEPNPFRHIDKYPIDRAKVEALKTSIKEKSFWDNILVRPHPTKKGKFQLAYGHHRWIALKELGIKETGPDIAVRDFSDDLMLTSMAEENLNWSTAPAIMIQTILAAKEYLEDELQKSEKWETSQDFLKGLFDSQRSFETTKGMGVGEGNLVDFLGGNWTRHKVREALKIIKDKTLSEEAIEAIPTMEQARVFRTSVKHHETPRPTQKKIAKKIVKEGIGRRDIPATVAEFSPPIPNLKAPKKRKQKTLPNVVEFVFKCENDTDSLTHRLKEICPEVADIANKGRLLGRLIPALKRLGGTIAEVVEAYERNRNEKQSRKKAVASVQVLD